MLNQTSHQNDLVMWTSTTHQAYTESLKSVNPYHRRIYWDLNKIIVMVITMFTLIMGVAGNVMILLTVVIRRLMHNPMSYYLVNLAVVHTILSLIVCPFLTFQILRDAHYRREVCALFYILFYSLALLLALSVLTIGVDRLWKERWNWHYLSHHSGRLALVTVAACWLTALALVAALELTNSSQHPLRSELCSPAVSAGRAAPHGGHTAAPGDIVMEAIFYICYGAAFCCLVFVQIIYGYKIRVFGHLPGTLAGDMLLQVPAAPNRDTVEDFDVAKVAQTRLTQLNKRLFEDGDQEARSVRMFLVLFTLHTVCWLPFYVVYSLNAHVSAEFVPFHIVEIVHYLALLSSPLNPALYYFFSVEFNMMIRHLISTMCCRSTSLSSGSSLTLDLERLQCLSDHQLETLTSGTIYRSGIGIGTHSEISVEMRPLTDEVGVSAGEDTSLQGSRELRELEQSDGPSAGLFDWKKPSPQKRRRRRPSSSQSPLTAESAEARPGSGDGSRSSLRRGRGSSLRAGGGSSERVVAPRDAASRSHWGRQPEPEPETGASGLSGSISLAGSDASGGSASRSHRVIASLKSLLRRGRQPGSRPSSRQDSATGTAQQTRKRTLASRMAALLQRRRVGPSAGRQRTASETSLVRRLVLAGLPSGVVATSDTAGGRRLAGVWRSPSGRTHRLDPDADDYPVLLERIADTGSGYRTPTGERIHHVCTVHHVHRRCHHHDWRRAAAAEPAAERHRQTSVGNWAFSGSPTEAPDRATQQFGQLLPLHSLHEAEVAEPRGPLRPASASASSADSDYQDEVKRVTDL